MTEYRCPECGYDGSGYKNGAEGWVDATSQHTEELGACCGKCCCEVDDAFRCGKCRRWLAGTSFEGEGGSELCGQCAGVDEA